MGFITIKIDDRLDEVVQKLTETQKEKLTKILSDNANFILAVIMHTGPEDLDRFLKIYKIYQMMFKMIVTDEDDFDSDDDQNEEKD